MREEFRANSAGAPSNGGESDLILREFVDLS